MNKPHIRDCGLCDNFHFDWNRRWCSAKETYIVTTVEIPTCWAALAGFATCKNYKEGYGHNHEF